MKANEKRFYSDLKVATLFLECGLSIQGELLWVDDYAIGFKPTNAPGHAGRRENKREDLDQLGMVEGKESLVMKGFVRVVTPLVREEKGNDNLISKNLVSGVSKSPREYSAPPKAEVRRRILADAKSNR